MLSIIHPHKLTDADIVKAVQHHDNAVIAKFYRRCRSYFYAHAAAMFIDGSALDDIFQESMIQLWREIETKRIVVVDNAVARLSLGLVRPMTSNLTTFLMSVAKRKHWEQLRTSHQQQNADLCAIDTLRYAERPSDVDERELAEQLVADTLNQMTQRCREILTMFYYEQRSLDEILTMRPNNSSKEGVKTSKYKCMNRLRQLVQQKFQSYGIRY